MTALYVVYDGNRKRLKMGRAGQGHPIVFKATDGRANEWVVPGVMPLGIDTFDAVPVDEIQLNTGDRFLFYTDGISERFNPSGDLYGEERVVEGMGTLDGLNAQEAVARLMHAVDRFAGGRPADDDQALVLGIVT